MRSWDHFISGLPDDLRAILEQIRTGSVGIDFRIHDADHTVDRLVDGLVTAASIMAGAQLVSRRAAPLLGPFSVPGLVAAGVGVATWQRLITRRKPHDTMVTRVTKGPRLRSALTTRRAARAHRATTIAGNVGVPEPMCGASFGARGSAGCDLRVARRVRR